MIEIRFHGRGGQGAVVASKLLAHAVFLDGKYCQSFPAFGVERRGAPVTAFLRVDDRPVRVRTQIYAPDHIVILDPLLVDQVPLTKGLKPGGTVILNSSKSAVEFKSFFKGFRIATVPAAEIAIRYHLGSPRFPIVNTAILGAVARALGIVPIESLVKAIKIGVPAHAEDNAEAAREAYRAVNDE
ncbi:MAG: pyruvate ferredoxin oxidoreductase [Deltaproteobacteria bacterium]|nr:MAG: pyruvate ferredoxin oxidoreductase [Deltaproteobacteria bacterium]